MGELPEETRSQVRAWEQRMRAAGASPATVRTRVASLRSFINAGGELLAPDEVVVVEWLAGQAAQWTRLTYYSSMRSWCSHLQAVGVLDHDPLEWVRRPRTPRRDPQPVVDSDLALLLEHAPYGSRVRAFVLLAAFAGLRVSEVARMRGEVITRESIRVVGKGGVEAYVPTHPVLWVLAQSMPRRGWWFERPSGSGHIAGSSVSTAIARLMADAGLDHTAHHLRHSFATRLLASGANVRQVQRAMRHASLEDTAGYLRVDDAEVSSAVRGLRMPEAA